MNVARILFDRGTIVLPAETPYDRQLVFEFADSSTKRYGAVQLAFPDNRWSVCLEDAVSPARCSCGQSLAEAVKYSDGGSALCRSCAQRVQEGAAPRPPLRARRQAES